MAIISRTLTYASGTIYGEAMLVVSMLAHFNRCASGFDL